MSDETSTKITFTEFLTRSKRELQEAVASIPVAKTTYRVKRYCKINLGESINEKECVSLKPKQRIIVEWRYENPNDPSISRIEFDGVDEFLDTYVTYWSSAKVTSWLRTNTIEESKL